MPVMNYTTTIPTYRSVAEVEHELILHGVTSIKKDYEDGKISGLYFLIKIGENEVPVKLPVQITEVFEALKREKKAHPKKQIKCTMEQAEMVAWRILKDWIEVQMQMVDFKQMKMEQIFLPQIQDRTGQTVFEKMRDSEYLLEMK